MNSLFKSTQFFEIINFEILLLKGVTFTTLKNFQQICFLKNLNNFAFSELHLS
jgi:hypothetical protein